MQTSECVPGGHKCWFLENDPIAVYPVDTTTQPVRSIFIFMRIFSRKMSDISLKILLPPANKLARKFINKLNISFQTHQIILCYGLQLT